jgi:trans-2,3-dihydro-3-hydroxyanthranilate isomerase
MQKIAAEINFAESTFVTGLDKSGNGNDLEFFTQIKKMQFAVKRRTKNAQRHRQLLVT